MQGLIKDLIDITIGGNNNNDEEEEDNRGERSRSTWAQVSTTPFPSIQRSYAYGHDLISISQMQVVSGDDDVDDRRKTQYSDSHNYNSKVCFGVCFVRFDSKKP